tara:strand:+ start:951 stop:1097 length:147 start_codon:yes stop_codon:yes gene_type:complete
MNETEKDYTCMECSVAYILIWTSKNAPERCPFCGAYVEEPETDEDNWD